jgi:hypothetical protein
MPNSSKAICDEQQGGRLWLAQILRNRFANTVPAAIRQRFVSSRLIGGQEKTETGPAQAAWRHCALARPPEYFVTAPKGEGFLAQIILLHRIQPGD